MENPLFMFDGKKIKAGIEKMKKNAATISHVNSNFPDLIKGRAASRARIEPA
jgi:hypothetical protein